MKKLLAMVLAVALILSCAAVASAEDRYLGVMLGTNVMSL